MSPVIASICMYKKFIEVCSIQMSGDVLGFISMYHTMFLVLSRN